ncbi:hypothetical protein SLS58_005739 [Diplodia intermedia]|uniref:Uncharacterized protein n=1 Tax=Diplodia intermedia TaxID=856260 RepID=A0ABR3TPZ1_9PEZI
MASVESLLPYAKIRHSTPRELVSLFRTASSPADVDDTTATTITHHLIAGVAHGSIHPDAFTIWLQLAKTPSAIALALTQNASAAIRRAGIKQLGKSLASSSWRETWDGLGGAEGVARVVGECLSVREVAEFARTVGRCGGGEEERRGEVAALVVALGGLDGCARARAPHSSSSDGGGGDGGDGGGGDDHHRPLSRALAPLAQACPAAFVEDALARGLSTTTSAGDVDADDAGTAAVILSQLTANGPGGGARGIIIQRHPAAVQAALHRALFDIDPDNNDNSTATSRRRRRAIDAAIRPALLALLHGAVHAPGGNNNDEAPPNFSPSMQFSLSVLRALAQAITQQRPHAFPASLFVSDLVEPLLRRCRRRRHAATTAQVREIVGLAAACLAAWPEAAGARVELDRVWGRHGRRGERRLLVHWTARLWARGDAGGGGFEGPLRALVRAAVVGVVVGPGPWRRRRERDVAAFLLEGVERGPARYAWLRLCLEEAGWGDLDDDGDLERMRGLGWDRGPFLWLDPAQALALFDRLQGCGGIAWGDADEVDHLRRDLLERKGDAEQVVGLATKRMDEFKQKAVSSKQQPDRAAHARDALRWAFLSGSLGVFKDAILWSRRYIRDPLTVREIYDYNIFEAKHLLVGSPGDLQSEATTMEALRNRVVEANDVLWTLLETIVMAMREPAAVEGTPNPTRNLCHDVIRLRWQKFSVALKKTGRFSEDDIYAIVWEDTLALLVKAEKAFLQPGPDRFASEDRKGVLGYSTTVDVENAGPATYRFFDEFAKARDEIWRDFRLRSLPATTLLPEPYPRGLAIQELTSSFRMRASAPEDLTPYIASRAHAVLFMDPAVALAPYPDDEDMQTAIEGFADCYLEALEIFVPKSLDQQEKKRRIDKAWAHAVGPLSQDRMSLPEAFRYWRGGTLSERFEFWPKEDANAPQELDLPKHDPRIPRVENRSEILEWDPLPPAVAPVKERRLDLVYIDIAKSIHIPYLGSVKILSEDHHPTVPGIPSDRLYTTLGKDTAVEFESRAMSALLFLDTKNGTDRMVLESPFPSAEEVRYPAMRLDSKFLQKGKKDIHWAFRILKSHSLTLPPLLLFRLAQNSLEEIQRAHAGSTIPYEQEKITFGLIALLHESDRPALAIDLGINAITNFPDASSWHRQLLTPTLLRRLPPADASACITRFADAITTSLQAAKQQQNPSDNPSPPAPRVKITTVKHLAQLLHGATYIPPALATEILTRILQAASHPDISHAVLDALLSMLTPSTSTSTSTNNNNNARVLTALETLIVDAGSRYSPDALPAKLDLVRGVPPLLSALLHWINSTTTATTAPTTTTTTTVSILPHLVHHIILPALSQLQSSTLAWATHRFAPDLPTTTPIPPLDPRVWGAVFTTVPRALIPRRVVADAVRWMRSCVDPAPGLRKVTDDIIRAREGGGTTTDDDDDERRWLALFGAGTRAVMGVGCGGVQWLCHGVLLSSSSSSDEHRGSGSGGANNDDDNAPVTIALAQDMVLQLADALTVSASPAAVCAEQVGHSWRDWHALVALLEPPAWMCAEDPDADVEALGNAWRANVRPLVVRLVEGVEAWRADETGMKPKPATLPDVFGVGLWLLPWPGVVGEGEGEEGWRRFADAVAGLVGRVVGEEVVYHRRFEQVKREVGKRVKGREDRVWVALRLGWLGGGPFGVVERLRIELALELLGGFDAEADGDLTGRVEEMVVGWKKADDEEVRRAAYELVERWGKCGRGFAAV